MPSDARGAAYRIDIQALRGIAVLLVVFYHFGWFGLAGGYLGVDMFFVISGYVITRLIAAGLAAQRFGVAEFYLRRIWRLLPALFVTLALSAAAAQLLLTDIDLAAFADQALGAVFGVANIVLWQQGGYFDTPAAMTPLLHLWSLSIEQQFYLLFPWLWVCVAAPRRLWGLWLVTAASLALCVALALRAPDAAFYLLPTRVWEFGLGAVAAVHAVPGRRLGIGMSLGVFVGVLLCAVHPLGALHPGVDAMIVCAGTALLLGRPSVLLRGVWPVRVLALCGTISYSLYLVHWPVLVFYRHYLLGEPTSMAEDALLFGVSLALAAALYAFVEQPLRTTAPRAYRKLGALGAAAAVLMLWCSGALAQASSPPVDWADERRPNHGLSIECEFDGPFEPRARCMSSAQPNVLVWGDSVAMQYVAGLAEGMAGRGGLVQATMSTCGPVLDAAPMYSERLGEAWARKCMAFNDSVLAWVAGQPRITHVVLAGRFFHYVEAGQKLLTRKGERPQALVLAKPLLADTVERLRAAGKKVVIVAAPPDEGFDVGACTERLLRGKPIGRRQSCDIDRQAYEALNRDALLLLQSAPAPVLWPSTLLCDKLRCAVMLDNQPIYRDAAHLSYRGSLLFARRFGLARKVLE